MNNSLVNSRIAAWIALIVIIAIIIVTFRMRPVWWMFFDEFFAFMMIFCQIVALYLGKFNLIVKRKLKVCAAVFGILAIISLISEFVIYQVVFS